MFSRGWELNLGWWVQSTLIVQSSGFQIIRAAHTSFRRDPPSLQPAKLYFSNTLRLHAFFKYTLYLKSMCLLQYTWIVQLDTFCSICVELYLIPSMPYCIRVNFFFSPLRWHSRNQVLLNAFYHSTITFFKFQTIIRRKMFLQTNPISPYFRD